LEEKSTKKNGLSKKLAVWLMNLPAREATGGGGGKRENRPNFSTQSMTKTPQTSTWAGLKKCSPLVGGASWYKCPRGNKKKKGGIAGKKGYRLNGKRQTVERGLLKSEAK